MAQLPAHVVRNREYWTELSKVFYSPGEREWQSPEIQWGIWGVKESQVQAFGALDQYRDKRVVELGCGTAYFSSWFARLGAQVVGVDITTAQLANARLFQTRFGVSFPLIEASAEDVPLESGVFDLAFSEYGASIWCDPSRWIAEASRLLRPGGRLVFLRNSTLSILCQPDQGAVRSELARDWRSLGRVEWPDDPGVEFHVPTGEMIRILRGNGMIVENLIEIMPPDDTESCGWEYMTLEWARRWPSEEIWVATKQTDPAETA